MTAPSPATDGKRVIILFGTGDIAGFDLDGKELWKRNLGRDYGSFAFMWVYGASPLLLDGQLFVQVLQARRNGAASCLAPGASGSRPTGRMAGFTS